MFSTHKTKLQIPDMIILIKDIGRKLTQSVQQRTWQCLKFLILFSSKFLFQITLILKLNHFYFNFSQYFHFVKSTVHFFLPLLTVWHTTSVSLCQLYPGILSVKQKQMMISQLQNFPWSAPLLWSTISDTLFYFVSCFSHYPLERGFVWGV